MAINFSANFLLQLKDHLLHQCKIEECLVCDQKVWDLTVKKTAVIGVQLGGFPRDFPTASSYGYKLCLVLAATREHNRVL